MQISDLCALYLDYTIMSQNCKEELFAGDVFVKAIPHKDPASDVLCAVSPKNIREKKRFLSLTADSEIPLRSGRECH
jgi:hypothetical protein